MSKLPVGAQDVQISRLPNGNLRFSAKVPARNIPGSYAEYTKVVDSTGKTISYVKTTYGPNGEIVHVKTKY